nr:hypothetical protein [Myxococcota bacterium]
MSSLRLVAIVVLATAGTAAADPPAPAPPAPLVLQPLALFDLPPTPPAVPSLRIEAARVAAER